MKNQCSNPFSVHDASNNIFVNREERFDMFEGIEAKKDTRSLGKFGLSLTGKQLNVFFLVIVFGLSVIFLRLAYLQIFQGGYYFSVSENNRIRVNEIKAPRGLVYDRNGKVLVKNISNFYLAVIPIDVPEDEKEKSEFIKRVSEISGIDENEISNAVLTANPQSYEPIIIKNDIDQQEAILAEIHSSEIPGLVLGTESIRLYDHKDTDSLSHVIGYLGRISPDDLTSDSYYSLTDYNGKTGLEFQYEDVLKGKKGKKQIEVDAFGRQKEVIAQISAIPGNDIYLTIDWEMQKTLQDIIVKTLEENKKSKAAAIALNPKNGEVLAMVSLPSFDNNIFSRGISQSVFTELMADENNPLFDRAIKGTYPSGSTIKPIMAAAALEEGVVNRWTSIYSTGGIYVQRWFFPDWKYGGHGPTNVTKAIAESVNTFFYYIGGGYNDFQGLGLDNIIYYGNLVGIGQKTNIDLPGEAAGLLPTEQWKKETKDEPWYIGDTYHLAIGQGDLLVTPLQVATWGALVANKGKIYTPHVVKEIHNSVNENITKTEPTILREHIFSEENLDIVRQGMRDAVLYGSARRLTLLDTPAAGKTGTAQWSQTKENHAWFLSFAPYDDPEIVLVVLIEEGGEGSAVSVPIAHEFYSWWENREN